MDLDLGMKRHRTVHGWPSRAAVLGLLIALLMATAVVLPAHDLIAIETAVTVDGETVSVTVRVEQGVLLHVMGETRAGFAGNADIQAAQPRIADHLGRNLVVAADDAPLTLTYAGWLDDLVHPGRDPPAKLSFLFRTSLPPGSRRLAASFDLDNAVGVPLVVSLTASLGAGVLPVRVAAGGERVEWAMPVAGNGATPVQPFHELVAHGFRHIVPHGLDHILFVLGLFLLTPRRRPLLIQVTVFTFAHSLTLALAAMRWLPWTAHEMAPVVEPLIALTITAVAIENLVARDLRWWRVVLVFAFGLVHGLGFAGAFAEILPTGIVRAVVGFNLGVELGQLAVVAAAASVTCWAWRRPWYRAVVVIPACLAIAATGLTWAVLRIIADAG